MLSELAVYYVSEIINYEAIYDPWLASRQQWTFYFFVLVQSFHFWNVLEMYV